MNFKLGKQDHEEDARTLRLARFVSADVRVPAKYDFDKGKAPFPVHVWGNDEWGDCVIAGETNHLLRLERIEQRRTIKISDKDAVDRYKLLTGSSSPGDGNDNGLVILDAMRNWFHSGYMVDSTGRNYTICAYGELDTKNRMQLRQGIYAMHGIHLGLMLPVAAEAMTRQGMWHYNGETGDEWEPGSWGGHLVYAKAYDKDSVEILTWGMRVKVTNEFIERYADEAWAVVDNFDSWRAKQTIDIAALRNELSQITSRVDQ